jgi:hypothetical protein
MKAAESFLATWHARHAGGVLPELRPGLRTQVPGRGRGAVCLRPRLGQQPSTDPRARRSLATITSNLADLRLVRTRQAIEVYEHLRAWDLREAALGGTGSPG